MPFAEKNAAPTGARITAKNEYFATAFTLFSRGTSWKKYLRHNALVRTWTVLAGINQAIDLTGTPAPRSYRANVANAAGIRIGQIRPGTSNKTETRMARAWPKWPHCPRVLDHCPFQFRDKIRQGDYQAYQGRNRERRGSH